MCTIDLYLTLLYVSCRKVTIPNESEDIMPESAEQAIRTWKQREKNTQSHKTLFGEKAERFLLSCHPPFTEVGESFTSHYVVVLCRSTFLGDAHTVLKDATGGVALFSDTREAQEAGNVEKAASDCTSFFTPRADITVELLPAEVPSETLVYCLVSPNCVDEILPDEQWRDEEFREETGYYFAIDEDTEIEIIVIKECNDGILVEIKRD